LILNKIDLARPNKPEMEGPKTARAVMRKMYRNGLKQQSLNSKEADKPVRLRAWAARRACLPPRRSVSELLTLADLKAT
jgi:hypothetical protein